MNCIKAFRAMYLEVLIEVTNSKRPSFIIDETQLIESILHVNGGVIEEIISNFGIKNMVGKSCDRARFKL